MGLHGLTAVPLTLALLSADPQPTARRKAVTHELLDTRVMAGKTIPHGPMGYLVVPSGHVFRVLGQQPILDEDGTKLGMLISYVGDTRDPAAATTENAELMDALSLDMQVMGETAVMAQARVGFDTRKPFNSSIAFHTSYLLRDGHWVALSKPPCAPSAPCARSGTIGDGPLELVDDPAFSFDHEGLVDAATVARRYALAVDAGDLDRMRAELSPTYISQVVNRGPDAWAREMGSYARVRKGAPRRELYRLLHRDPGSGRIGTTVMFALDLGVAGKRALEQVLLERESGRWRVIGYGFYYPKEAARPQDKRP